MNKYINDLSFSNIVNLTQDSVPLCGDLLNNLANELEILREKIKKTEKELQNQKLREQTILSASKKITQNILKKELPLTVQRKDYLVIATETDLTLERNVI